MEPFVYHTSFYNVGWTNKKYNPEEESSLAEELRNIIVSEGLHSLFVSEIFELADGNNIGRNIGDHMCEAVNEGTPDRG